MPKIEYVFICKNCSNANIESDMEKRKLVENYMLQCPNCSCEVFTVIKNSKY